MGYWKNPRTVIMLFVVLVLGVLVQRGQSGRRDAVLALGSCLVTLDDVQVV